MIPSVKMSAQVASAGLLLAVGPASLAAQNQAPAIPYTQGQGMFAGTALGVQHFGLSTTPPNPTALRIRLPGITNGALEPWTTTRFGAITVNHPDYSAEALCAHWVPMVAYGAVDLFGAPQSNAVIVALSVDRRDGELPERPGRTVFSLTAEREVNNADRDQILISQLATGSTAAITAVPLKTQTGVPISEKLGLVPTGHAIIVDPDDVTGLCGRGPKEQQDYDRWTATAEAVNDFEKLAEMGFAMQRHLSSTFKERILLSASGLDIAGYDFGLVEFEFDLYDGSIDPLPVPFLPGSSSGWIVVLPGQTVSEISPASGQLTDSVRVRSRTRLHRVDLQAGSISRRGRSTPTSRVAGAASSACRERLSVTVARRAVGSGASARATPSNAVAAARMVSPGCCAPAPL